MGFQERLVPPLHLPGICLEVLLVDIWEVREARDVAKYCIIDRPHAQESPSPKCLILWLRNPGLGAIPQFHHVAAQYSVVGKGLW